jgi:hypothetical protein
VNWRAGMGTGTSAGMMSRTECAAVGAGSGMGETPVPTTHPPNQPPSQPVKLTRVQAGQHSLHAVLWGCSRITAPPCPVTLLRKPSLAVLRRESSRAKKACEFSPMLLCAYRGFFCLFSATCMFASLRISREFTGVHELDGGRRDA